MSSAQKANLEHNKEMVDKYLSQKKITFAEMVPMDFALDFLEYMKSEGVADDLACAEYKKEREFINIHEVFPMIYMMDILSGDWAVRKSQRILKNEAALRVMGFNEEQISNGLTKRGSKNQHGEGFARQSGIMASTTLIDNLACFTLDGLIECFNAYIKRVSEGGRVDFGGTYILDSTIVETPANYPGAKPTKRKDGDGEDGEETIWGFKLFILSSARTLTPVALHITTANDADSPMLTGMAERGISNLGAGKIKLLLVDRGFIDGRQLHRLKFEMGIDFCVPAKKGMDIWKDVTGLRDGSKDSVEEWSYGKKGVSGGYLSKGSVSYSQYADEPAGANKSKGGAPIDAVVVTRWAGKEIAPGKEKVILTSKDAADAIGPIKEYGQRSLIENCNFRELKQAAALNDLPQFKNKNAETTAKIHMLLCVFALAIFNILVETVYADEAYANEKIPKNIREFRFTKECEKAKIFVLVKHYYHVYDMKEFLGFAGFTVEEP
jgi:hypothetical protein